MPSIRDCSSFPTSPGGRGSSGITPDILHMGKLRLADMKHQIINVQPAEETEEGRGNRAARTVHGGSSRKERAGGQGELCAVRDLPHVGCGTSYRNCNDKVCCSAS